ncbi:MAG: D-tyrosyl-tRNA(Tyr) deacylase [Frankiales bacterium]|nr:D-tyrosyl-tRNA(Tyr) deacylase [Frankiales bacterium]
MAIGSADRGPSPDEAAAPLPSGSAAALLDPQSQAYSRPFADLREPVCRVHLRRATRAGMVAAGARRDGSVPRLRAGHTDVRLLSAGENALVRAVVSRVSAAAVTINGAVVGEIGAGLLSLVGAGRDDDEPRARALARKIAELRVFPTEEGARSISDLGLPVLVVSQFTLYADTRKGRRPSWQDAAPAEQAEPLVDEVVAELRRRGTQVATGIFGARMRVSSVNEGPMTLLLEV